MSSGLYSHSRCDPRVVPVSHLLSCSCWWASWNVYCFNPQMGFALSSPWSDDSDLPYRQAISCYSWEVGWHGLDPNFLLCPSPCWCLDRKGDDGVRNSVCFSRLLRNWEVGLRMEPWLICAQKLAASMTIISHLTENHFLGLIFGNDSLSPCIWLGCLFVSFFHGTFYLVTKSKILHDNELVIL